MNYRFQRLIEALLKEVNTKNLGVFPGKFKPPHKGHFKTCLHASRENDLVFVLISDKEHEGYKAEQALTIWNIYRKYITNLIPFIVSPTPVLACYDLANILNNGEYKSLESQQPKSNILGLVDSSKELESFLNVGNNITLNLYSSPEDQKRFERIKKEPYMGKTVLDINFRPVDRLTSATSFRQALRQNTNVESFLPPELKKEDILNVINILNGKF